MWFLVLARFCGSWYSPTKIIIKQLFSVGSVNIGLRGLLSIRIVHFAERYGFWAFLLWNWLKILTFSITYKRNVLYPTPALILGVWNKGIKNNKYFGPRTGDGVQRNEPRTSTTNSGDTPLMSIFKRLGTANIFPLQASCLHVKLTPSVTRVKFRKIAIDKNFLCNIYCPSFHR